MSQSEIRNAVVLVIDRLGTNMLGAYGSTWFETPNFNRMAARSLVFDHAIAQTPELASAYQGIWDPGVSGNLLKRLGDAGVGSVLLTDDREVADLTFAKEFDRIVPVESGLTRGMADSMDQTELANFFALGAHEITELDSGSCLWLHSRGLSGAWDAPMRLRTQLADSEDPDPPQFHQPPSRPFDPMVDDPDELLGYQQVCAAQITLIDDFLGVMLDLLDSEVGESTLFCLLSTRGYPLGEHGLVGDSPTEEFESCYNESVHIPMMVSLPNQPEFAFAKSLRNGSLIQPNWISGLLLDWFGPANSTRQSLESMSRSFPDKFSEVACTIRGEAAAIQTHAWKLIRNRHKAELFAKPDDRYEVNDVSRRCPHIVESLSEFLDQLVAKRSVEKRSVEKGGVEKPADFELPHELATRLD